MRDRRTVERNTRLMRERVSASPFHRSLGIIVDDVDEGTVELRLEAQETHVNLMGSVHGGVLASAADVAAGLAVRSAIPEGTDHVTVHLDVQYLSPATPGTLHASGQVTRIGRRLAFAQARISDAAGATVATAQATVAIGRPPSETVAASEAADQ
jgi:uncharacterized protein (TIGR00369 family)